MTPIEFSCPHCAKQIKVKPHGAGRTIDCPGCKSPVVVPSPEMAAVGDGEPTNGYVPGFDDSHPFQPDPLAPVQNPDSPEASIDNLFKWGSGGSGSEPKPRPTPGRIPQTTPTTPVRIAAHEASLPASRSYPALSRIAGIIRILAYLVAIFGGIGILLSMLAVVPLAVANGRSMPGAVVDWSVFGIPALIGLIVLVLLLVAASELITLAIHIQSNTLATAHASRRAG